MVPILSLTAFKGDDKVMKFYIFANEKDGSFTASVNDAVYSSMDYMSIRSRFDTINKEFKYRNTYLVADLNIVEFKQGMFTRPVNLSRDSILASQYLPFFIIGEFHYGKDESDLIKYINPATGKFDPNRTIRCDAVSIKLPGFTQQFYNNQSAILSYLNFVDNSYYATLEIKINVANPARRDSVVVDRILGITTTTKKKLNHQGFNRLELPGKVLDCYDYATFDRKDAPVLFDLKNGKEDLGDIHTRFKSKPEIALISMS